MSEDKVRALCRQWAWKIREDGAALPPEMLTFALRETASALRELAGEDPLEDDGWAVAAINGKEAQAIAARAESAEAERDGLRVRLEDAERVATDSVRQADALRETIKRLRAALTEIIEKDPHFMGVLASAALESGASDA